MTVYPVCGWKFRLHVHRRLQQGMHIDRAHWYVARSFNIGPLDGSYFHFCCVCGEGLTKESRFFHLLANPCFAGRRVFTGARLDGVYRDVLCPLIFRCLIYPNGELIENFYSQQEGVIAPYTFLM